MDRILYYKKCCCCFHTFNVLLLLTLGIVIWLPLWLTNWKDNTKVLWSFLCIVVDVIVVFCQMLILDDYLCKIYGSIYEELFPLPGETILEASIVETAIEVRETGNVTETSSLIKWLSGN